MPVILVSVVAAAAMIADGLFWLDSGVALVIALVIGYHAVRLIRSVLADLREKQSPR